MSLPERIQSEIAGCTVHSDLRGGRPCMKGTRITASQAIAQIADGDSLEDLERIFDINISDAKALLNAISVAIDQPLEEGASDAQSTENIVHRMTQDVLEMKAVALAQFNDETKRDGVYKDQWREVMESLTIAHMELHSIANKEAEGVVAK